MEESSLQGPINIFKTQMDPKAEKLPCRQSMNSSLTANGPAHDVHLRVLHELHLACFRGFLHVAQNGVSTTPYPKNLR